MKKTIKASEAIEKQKEWMEFIQESDPNVCQIRDYLDSKDISSDRSYSTFLALSVSGYEIDFD